MILLTSTSDILRVVTGAAVSTLTVHASYVDNSSGTITPAAGTFHRFPAYFVTSCHFTIANTLDVTAFFAAG